MAQRNLQATLDRIRYFLKSDRAILVICIGIAFVFWCLNKLQKNYTVRQTYHLTFRLPPGKVFEKLPPSTIDANVYGSGWDLMDFSFNDKHKKLIFDLDNVDYQMVNLKSLKNKIIERNTHNVEIKDINEENIPIYLDEEATKKVPLLAVAKISFLKGFQQKNNIQIEPNIVIVKGPKSLVDSIQHWETDTIILHQMNESIIKNIHVKKNVNSPITCNFEQAKVKIFVEQVTEKQIFVPVIIKNAPQNVKIFPKIITLTCTTGLSKYNLVNSSQFEVEADLLHAKPHSAFSAIPLTLTRQPVFVSNVKIKPQAIEYLFEEQ